MKLGSIEIKNLVIEVIKLKTKLDYIKGNYIELPSNKFVNVGLLFEKLLGIENNSFFML